MLVGITEKQKRTAEGCQAWQQAWADAYEWQRGVETRSLEPHTLYLWLLTEYAERQQWRIPGRRTGDGEDARRKSSRFSGTFFLTLLTSIFKYSVPLFLFINAIQYLKHDTLIIMIIKYGTQVLRCTQNTSRRSLSQQVDARWLSQGESVTPCCSCSHCP